MERGTSFKDLGPSRTAWKSTKPTPAQPAPATLTHEIVVPGRLSGHHEEAPEAIRQQHLDTLVTGGQVAFGVVAFVCVLPPPLVAAGSQLVGSKGTGARGEAGKKLAWSEGDQKGTHLPPIFPQGSSRMSCHHVDICRAFPTSPRPRLA